VAKGSFLENVENGPVACSTGFDDIFLLPDLSFKSSETAFIRRFFIVGEA
jgi:hypothetical protein